MSCTIPTPRRVGAALDVLLALPPAVLADLAERLIDRLDALDGDPDLEPDDHDACPAGDDDPALSRPRLGVRGMALGPGDYDDAEAEPDCEGLAVVARMTCCAVRLGG